MRLAAAGAIALALSVTAGAVLMVRFGAPAVVATAPACDTEPPLGALPPSEPAWCVPLAPSLDTSRRDANSWNDTFASGLSHARLAPSYVVYENPRGKAGARTTVYRTEHFAHNGHWMVDIAGHGAPNGIYEGSAEDFYTGPNNGGALLRPDMGFRFEDGRLVIEFDASAGMTVYQDHVWPEIVVTTAPAPTAKETNGWYAAGLFGGYPSIGCAFPSDRMSECRVYDTEKITAWLSGHSAAGASSKFGGSPETASLASAWHQCGPTDPDSACRDRFRVELTRDDVTIFVNGVRYMEHRGLPAASQLPAQLLTSTVYVYFASWAYLASEKVARVHWGRIAINPAQQLMR